MGEIAKEHVATAGRQKNITMWVRNKSGETLMVLTLNFSLLPVKPV